VIVTRFAFPIAKNAIAGALLLTIAAGCNRNETKKADDRPKKSAAFNESTFTEITPTADGGAYAVGIESGLWYLRGREAVIVQFPPLPADKADTFFLGLEITPLADGGAYARSQIDKSIWYLREGTALGVRDVPTLTTKPISGGLSIFPLYVAERKKRLQAEKDLEERQEAPADRDE
jgi:hypothetical protein